MPESAPTQISANQLVAHNLRLAREASGETQEQAAQRLWPYIGQKWSKASFSAAETSAKTERAREFTANEILAFAQVFNRPIAFFFTPPDEVDSVLCGAIGDAWRPVRREELLRSRDNLTLWDHVVLRDQVATLRRAVDALEQVEALGEQTTEGLDEQAGPEGITDA